MATPTTIRQTLIGVITPRVDAVCVGVTPFSIDSFTRDGFGPTVEIGTAINGPGFLATYSAVPATASLTDNRGNPAVDVVGTPNAFNAPYLYDSDGLNDSDVWTLTADAGGPSDNAQVSLSRQARTLVGWSPNPALVNEGDFLGMNQLFNQLQANEAFSLTLNPINGYVYHCWHTDFGARVGNDYSIGGAIPGGFSEVGTFTLTIPGGTATYRYARTNLIQNSPGGTLYVGNP